MDSNIFILYAILFCIISLFYLIERYRTTGFTNPDIKVYFNGFWGGFNEDGMKPFLEICKTAFGQNCSIGDENDSSVIIQSVFGPNMELTKKFKYKIFYTGENWKGEDINAYDILLAGEETNDKYISFPLFLLSLNPKELEKLELATHTKRTDVPEKDVIAIISNGGGGVRNAFLEELEKHFNVSYGGGYKNNIGGKLTHNQGTEEYNNYIGQYKFIVSMENSEAPHYITEKILQGMSAKIIPIYWGGSSVDKYFNKERFLWLKDSSPESMQEIIKQMKFLSENPDKWLEMTNRHVFAGTDGLLPYSIIDIGSQIRAKLGL